MDINQAHFELVKDIHKEYLILSPSVYFDFAPAEPNLDKGRYLKVDHAKKDPMGYIKMKNRELWLFRRNNKLEFMPLHMIDGDFTIRQPLLCWFEYLREPTFIIYLPTGYGEPVITYIKYVHGDSSFDIIETTDALEATPFSYKVIPLPEYLAHTKLEENIIL